MMKQPYLKWICGALCALLLCAVALGVPVREAKAAGEAISSLPTTIKYNDTFTLTANADTSLALADSDPFVWTVDGTVLTASAPNNNGHQSQCLITASAVGTNGSVSCTINYADSATYPPVTVSHNPVTVAKATPTVTISRSPADAKLTPNGNVQLTASVSPSIGGAFSWTGSTSATTVSFDTANAKITATGASVGATGSATATFTPTDMTNYDVATSALYTVAVELVPRTLTISGATTMDAGGSVQLSAAPSAGSGTVTWSAVGTPPAGLSVDGTGKVTAANGATGAIEVQASVGVDGDYAAASDTHTVTASLIAPVITWGGTTDFAVGDTSAKVTATSTNTDAANPPKFAVQGSSSIISVNADTGALTATGAGSATITVTQTAAAGGNYAALSAGTFTKTVTAHASALGFNPSSVTITADKGTAAVTAAVQYAGSAALAPVTLSGWNNDVILVHSTSSGNGSNTFTITARSQGTTSITATTTVGGTTKTATLPVTVSYSGDSYFTIDSWYYNLDYKNRYTEITATLHNPGKSISPNNLRTQWKTDNSVAKTLWTHEYLQYDQGSNTYFSRIRLKAMRNGTIVATMSAAGTSVSEHVHVSKMSYIPQSGQDSTGIYVVSALLLTSALATAGVYLYRRKRSRS